MRAPSRPTRRATSRRHRCVVAVALVAGIGLLTACSTGNDTSGPSSTQPAAPDASVPAERDGAASVELRDAGTAESPTVLVTRPGDDDHLWVAERPGTILRYAVGDDGTLTVDGDPVLDITDETTTESERGLLGMVFSPDGDQLYVSSTDSDGNTNVDRYTMDGDVAVPSSRVDVFAVDQPYPNHNGGNIVFGPDGRLWLGLGDGGAADDPENRAQDPDTPLGKVLAIDVESGDASIVVSGVRNPWRFAFDEDGSLWIADVGQNAVEEIDHLEPEEIDGTNLGWSGYEGSEPYLDGDGRRPADAIGPVFEYTHDDGNCSITGGFPYHGETIPELDGAFLFADYCAGRIRAITLDQDGEFAREIELGLDVERPISFGQDQDGEPYVLSETGSISRIVPAD